MLAAVLIVILTIGMGAAVYGRANSLNTYTQPLPSPSYIEEQKIEPTIAPSPTPLKPPSDDYNKILLEHEKRMREINEDAIERLNKIQPTYTKPEIKSFSPIPTYSPPPIKENSPVEINYYPTPKTDPELLTECISIENEILEYNLEMGMAESVANEIHQGKINDCKIWYQ